MINVQFSKKINNSILYSPNNSTETCKIKTNITVKKWEMLLVSKRTYNFLNEKGKKTEICVSKWKRNSLSIISKYSKLTLERVRQFGLKCFVGFYWPL